jgi:predicted  nucleic acid-binding Zn-ribbon protein
MSSFCARCGKPIPGGAAECGCSIDLGSLEIEGLDKRPSRRPSAPVAAPAVVRPEDADFGDDFDGGSPLTSTPAAHQSTPGGSSVFGAEIDLEDSDVGPSLELDAERPQRRSTSPPSSASERRASVPPPVRHALAPADGPPTRAEPEPENLASARKLAAYGECSGALQAPMYALRVRRRQKELRAEVKRLGEALLAAEGEAEEAMARIATCIRDVATADATLSPLIDTVVRAEAQAKDRELAVIAADTSSAVLSDVVKQRMAQVKDRIAPSRAEIERILPDFRAKQEAHRRVMAQVRRSEIELRNLRDLANAKDTEASAQTDPARKGALAAQAAELRGRSPEYESVLAAHRATATEMEGPIADLERGMAQHRRALAEGEAEIGKLQVGQQREAVALDRAKEERMQILAAARVTVRNRLAEVARAAIARGFQATAIAPLLPDANALADRAGAVRRDLELYSAALEVHDRPKVQQGWLILGGGGGGALLAIVALVASC